MCYYGRHNKHIKMQTKHPEKKYQPAILTMQPCGAITGRNVEIENSENTQIHFVLEESQSQSCVLQVSSQGTKTQNFFFFFATLVSAVALQQEGPGFGSGSFCGVSLHLLAVLHIGFCADDTLATSVIFDPTWRYLHTSYMLISQFRCIYCLNLLRGTLCKILPILVR